MSTAASSAAIQPWVPKPAGPAPSRSVRLRNRQLDAGCGDIGNVRRLVRIQQQHVREHGDS
jgi:hypothetical protein